MFLKAGFGSTIVFLLLSLSTCLASAQEGLYEKMMQLAQENNPEAQYHIGMFLNNGIGVSKNPKQAFEWFQKSARNGDMLAPIKWVAISQDNLKVSCPSIQHWHWTTC